jgi:DNA-binding transcriptional LysR family regulator
MNFRHLEIFFAVMTSGTVTEAARHLGVSQPSVTTTLKQAEAKLGFRLFLREGGRLIPTAEARILFEEAERAHESLAAIESLAQRLQVGNGGHVRIAAVPTICLELLPDAIEVFEGRHTGFSYSVSTLNTEQIINELDTRKGTFHLGFTFGGESDRGIACKNIGEVELLALFPKDWQVPDGPDFDLRTVSDRPYVSGFEKTALGQACRRLFAEAEAEPRIVAHSHAHHLAGRLVQRGIGYTILDAVTVRALQNDRLGESTTVRHLRGSPC